MFVAYPDHAVSLAVVDMGILAEIVLKKQLMSYATPVSICLVFTRAPNDTLGWDNDYFALLDSLDFIFNCHDSPPYSSNSYLSLESLLLLGLAWE